MDDAPYTRRDGGLNGFHRAEMKLYKALGVERFRGWVLRREARRGKRKRNYHLAHLTVAGAAAFSRYLWLNTFLHCTALAFVALAVYLRYRTWPFLHPGDVLYGGLFLFNIYCLMLQRYTALRLLRLRTRARRGRARIQGPGTVRREACEL